MRDFGVSGHAGWIGATPQQATCERKPGEGEGTSHEAFWGLKRPHGDNRPCLTCVCSLVRCSPRPVAAGPRAVRRCSLCGAVFHPQHTSRCQGDLGGPEQVSINMVMTENRRLARVSELAKPSFHVART